MTVIRLQNVCKQMLETGNVLLEPLVAKQLSPSSQQADDRLLDES